MTKDRTNGWVCPVCGKGKINRMSQKAFSIHWISHKNGPIYESKKITEKICSICNKKLPLVNFRRIKTKNNLKYYTSYCHSCENKRHREYTKRHPEWVGRNNHKCYVEWKTKVAGNDCEICGENRTLDVAHIIPRLSRSRCARNAIYNKPDNILGLCPTHHRLFDENKLNENEYDKIKLRVEAIKEEYAKI